MKIKDFEVNSLIKVSLVVKTVTARETKSKKPYLQLEFFDGTDTITGNYWDWVSGNIPAVNAILDVTAQVSEWQGTKQLNVKSLATCTTHTLADFMPSSDYDINVIYTAAHTFMSSIKDDTLRIIATAILEELKELWLVVPGAVRVHHNYVGGTLVHSYNVAVKARALASVTEGANVDLATVGAMLHDIGKLYTYRLDGVNIDKTANGKLYDHIFIGAEFIGNFAEAHVDVDDPYVYGKVRLLRHIILSHHGSLEFGSPVTPQCIEAYIVHYADALDATNEQIRVATKNAGEIWTDKIWTLSNSPHLSHTYVDKIMSEENDAATT